MIYKQADPETPITATSAARALAHARGTLAHLPYAWALKLRSRGASATRAGVGDYVSRGGARHTPRTSCDVEVAVAVGWEATALVRFRDVREVANGTADPGQAFARLIVTCEGPVLDSPHEPDGPPMLSPGETVDNSATFTVDILVDGFRARFAADGLHGAFQLAVESLARLTGYAAALLCPDPKRVLELTEIAQADLSIAAVDVARFIAGADSPTD